MIASKLLVTTLPTIITVLKLSHSNLARQTLRKQVELAIKFDLDAAWSAGVWKENDRVEANRLSLPRPLLFIKRPLGEAPSRSYL